MFYQILTFGKLYFIFIIFSASSKSLNNNLKIIINERIAKIETDFQNSSLLKLFHVDNYDLIFWRNTLKKQHSITLTGVAYGYFFFHSTQQN